jgi:hypothetical protein
MASLAVVWHYWIGVSLIIPAILLVIIIPIMYVVRVEMPRFNREDQPTPDEFEALEARKG